MDWILDTILTFLNKFAPARAVIGIGLLCFVPGLAWTFVMFKRLTVPERIALSFGLSIAIVTLGILFTSMLFSMRISGTNTIYIILVTTAVPVVIILAKRLFTRHGDSA